MFFWNSLAFSMIQEVLAIWSLVPLPFLNPAWTSWKFTVHILLKPILENFEHDFTSVWGVYNCVVVRAFFGIAFFEEPHNSLGSMSQKESVLFNSIILDQGFSVPGSWTGTGPWTFRKQDSQKEVSSRQTSKASSLGHSASLTLLPDSTSCQVSWGVRFSGEREFYCAWIILKPSTPPYPGSMEKLSYMKPVPGAEKVGDCYPRQKIAKAMHMQVNMTVFQSKCIYIKI